MAEKKYGIKISVIIPMYNTEDYIGECLDSLLCQTFQDFEVIVVDDCSTDGSLNVVKGYRPKFKGRLKIIESEKNSGGCAMPRNIGMKYAKGKYIFFLDSDDLIIKTTFEKLYNVAERFDADVVQCEKFYSSDTPNLKGAELTIKSFKSQGYVEVPTLDTGDVRQRIKDFNSNEYVWTVWSKLLRHDFLIENKIENPTVLYEEDLIFTIYCVVCAKNLVKFPDPVNIYRYRPGSVMHRSFSLTGYIRKWANVLATGFAHCDKFLSGIEFYKQNPEMKYIVLDIISQDVFGKLVKVYGRFSPAVLDEIIREEFGKVGDSTALAAFFFNMSLMYSMHIGTQFLKNSATEREENSRVMLVKED